MKKNIDELKENPNNPRHINKEKFELLKNSLKEFPQMLEIRPIVINKEGIILGGNMRYKAAKELGWSVVDCIEAEFETKEEEFIVKDNLGYGDWTWVNLVEDYKSFELEDWGLDIPVWYKDLENSLKEKKIEEKTETQKKEKTETPVSTNRALYLFYEKEQREELLEIIKTKYSDTSNEVVFMDLMKNII